MGSDRSSSLEKVKTALRVCKNGLHPVNQIFMKSIISLSINKSDISNSRSTSCFNGANSQQMNTIISEGQLLRYNVIVKALKKTGRSLPKCPLCLKDNTCLSSRSGAGELISGWIHG